MREADDLTISSAECHEIWEPKPPGILWATPGLLQDCFTCAFFFTSIVISKQFYSYAAICLSFHFDLVPLLTFILRLLRTSGATIK